MVKLRGDLIGRMKKHSHRSYPEECCGFLLGSSEGDVKLVRDILELGNAMQENRARRYIVTPRQYRDAEHRAEELHLELLGVYHSHPDHPARPSQFDIEHALPWWSYIIIAVDRGVPAETTCWLLRDDRTGFDGEQLEIEGPTPILKAGVPGSLGTQQFNKET